ncbi:COG1470 family protein [Streptomyces flavofungini]|uniref:COG1470 family protein n=1 Tax=Streptomyces flavofungini TaxID=68200 RepID=UPI0025AF71D1|nr:hypothetical protein [Streptomyces flavofungini]WJV48284.1 hypothetical protein QUY26_23845 [Streptomyces flavofungini]
MPPMPLMPSTWSARGARALCAGAAVLLASWCAAPAPGARAAEAGGPVRAVDVGHGAVGSRVESVVDSGTAWSIAPSAGSGSRAARSDGRPCFYAEGAPGAVLKDTLSVTNPGAAPRTVTLRGAGPAGTGKWLAFARRQVTVPPRTRAEVPFTVTVPPGAAPGDRLGEVVARGGGRDARVAVRLRVSGPALAALTVERVRVDAGARRISYDLVNRGTTVLAPQVVVRADGMFGELLDRRARQVPSELAPGRRVSLSEPWDGVPALDSVDVRLTVTAAGGVAERASASALIVPWPEVVGSAVGGAAVVVGGFVWVRRRRRAEVCGDG